ncbi:IPT/TIG domain-containing protein [Nocardia bovistercoris]|uniref:IPT/TIG domain-containing protein n=1 Tax=Nocardia bovistercoris TaxID=2785916 RepID=A0A931I800_9NOCA|nr:IPT/TIG domain-containing protein [Nocardia bovistercoris]MBH0775545.1 IPT/TIG domain-containing protein [Nocardia bovistercoris]
MSDFSRQPATVLRESLVKGYSGIHIEQGVPILDRDLNLMHDLLAAGVRSLFARYIGDGVPTGGEDAFAIRAMPTPANNVMITGPGQCLVGGIEVTIDAATDYSSQPGGSPSALTVPVAPQSDPRRDIVYLDIFLVEVDGTPDLDNGRDVGMQTSVRIKPAWIVRVAEDVDIHPVPPPADGHVHYPLAQLLRRRDEATITEGLLFEDRLDQRITDLRRRRLTVASLESRLSRLENALFAPSFTQDVNIGQVKPKFGRVGQEVILRGRNFDKGAIEVLFADVAAQLKPPLTDDTIVALVPGGVTREGVSRNVRITVRNEIGSAISDKVYLVQPIPVFVADAAQQFEPKQGSAQTPVLLRGFNFTPGTAAVTLGDKVAPVQSATYNELRVLVPEGLAPNGDFKFKVSFPAPRGSVEATTTFRVLAG